MTAKELREKFLEFFKSKGHTIVPSSSLIPDDPSVLLTTAGMQQFVPYLSGKKDPVSIFGTRHLASAQKCFRTSDIDQVGDESHHTFFEMLGNWSIGGDAEELGEKGYFKKGAIELALEFLNSKLQIPNYKLWITVFAGEGGIPKDEEAIALWQEAGIPGERIKEFGKEDNFWGPTANEGPCGPCSEIHYDLTQKSCRKGKACAPNCKCGRFVEIWNLVFMEYDKKLKVGGGEYEYVPLPQKNIDTGVGLERLLAILSPFERSLEGRQNKKTAYETDLFLPIIEEIEKNSSKPYTPNPIPYRIIADHIRGACFLIADGILPSNTEQGYILRRILRRAIRYAKLLNLPENFLIPLAQKVIEIYKQAYPELQSKQNEIISAIQNEGEKFGRALEKGLSRFEKLLKLKIESARPRQAEGEAGEKLKVIEGKEVFDFYQNYGFPLELVLELAKENNLAVDEESFNEEFKRHQELSRAGKEKKFGGHGVEELKNESEKLKVMKLHTATHLLHQALREVLGSNVKQMGSDITPERLRFDFLHTAKMTAEEIKKVEDLVNQKIKEDLAVTCKEMPYEEAIKSGALAFFKEKYPKEVLVYTIGDFSKEICAGPHVKKTLELGSFKIIKEEASSAGVRRIKARVE